MSTLISDFQNVQYLLNAKNRRQSTDLLKSSFNLSKGIYVVLNFEDLLPFLEPDYRRKLCFSIQIGYLRMLQDPDLVLSDDFLKFRSMYRAVQKYDMSKLEATGQTNTKINPFDVL